MLGERTEEQVQKLMEWAASGVEKGSHYPNLSFEEGILHTVLWLDGDCEHGPHEVEA